MSREGRPQPIPQKSPLLGLAPASVKAASSFPFLESARLLCKAIGESCSLVEPFTNHREVAELRIINKGSGMQTKEGHTVVSKALPGLLGPAQP